MNLFLPACKTHLKDKKSANKSYGVLTCENKFVAHSTLQNMAFAILSQHNVPDTPYPEGFIESIYFDDYKLTSYMEKQNGDSFKSKVRIRWYSNSTVNDQGEIKAYLEIKNRIGSARDKQRHSFFADKSLLCNSGLNTPALVNLLYKQALIAGFSIPFNLIPAINIKYHRHRFICPVTGTRINLDTKLESNRINKDIIPFGTKINSEYIVCEAKSALHKSWSWNDSLFRLGFRLQSFSKYGKFMETHINKGT